MNYYNEHDPKAAAWLRELIKAGEIPDGKLDERSILDVRPNDLVQYAQCHFFAGIGGWSLALALADWPCDRQVWTGSCPCQPFSCAGRGMGEDDERHLWPYFRNLIGQCRPSIVFGEQVASPDGRAWLARVRSEMESAAYAFGASDLCAAGVFAPHKRQRNYWVAVSKGHQWPRAIPNGDKTRSCGLTDSGLGSVADTESNGRDERRAEREGQNGCAPPVGTGSVSGLDDPVQRGRRTGRNDSIRAGRESVGLPSASGGLEQPNSAGRHTWQPPATPTGHGSPIEPASGHIAGVGHSERTGRQMEGHKEHNGSTDEAGEANRIGSSSGDVGVALGDTDMPGPQRRVECGERAGKRATWQAGAWDDSEIVWCLNPKTGKLIPRRVESGTFPLANGVSGRVGLLRGYGNAIVPQVAAEFIKAAMI